MGTRRDLLAVQTIVVTFASAMHAIGMMDREDEDTRIILADRARHRALRLLDQTAARLPYVDGSALDIAIRRARERIEQAQVGRD